MTDSASLIPFHPQSLPPCHLTCFLGAVLCACHALQLSPSREIILNASGSHQKPQGGGMLTLSSLDIKLGVSCSCSPLSCCACSRTTSPFKQRGGPNSRQNGPLCALGAELQPPATTTPVLNLQEGTLTSSHGIHPPWHRDKGSRTLLGVWCVTALHWSGGCASLSSHTSSASSHRKKLRDVLCSCFCSYFAHLVYYTEKMKYAKYF